MSKKICFFILAMPFIMVMSILRPFILVRLGLVDIGRFGGVYDAEWYLAERAAGIHQKRSFDLFFFFRSTGIISNQFWEKLWKRTLNVFPFWRLGYTLYTLCHKFQVLHVHIIPLDDVRPIYGKEYKGFITHHCILKHYQPPVLFTPEEELLGKDALEHFGISQSKPFICFHARDSAYLERIAPNCDWRYHGYRDSDIKNYIPAAEELMRRGYYTVRMGVFVKEKLSLENPLFIDYAMNGKRTEFLDIYLGAKCRFFVCSDTGISMVPEVFRRPLVYVNWVPLLRCPAFYVHNALLIPKKFILKKEKRELTFREIIFSPIGSTFEKGVFDRMGIELIENTPEEITAVALEMDERFNGRWKTTDEDEELQRRFWKLFESYELNNPGVRIGAEFLRQHKYLLDN
ncbi:MAG: TIGR04372 family glycosyltransferase [Candidatus Omnitrophota bacterium]|nr:TIGR04372 family glycosyltransferase [Candidatus Omnitrophota bacterium]